MSGRSRSTASAASRPGSRPEPNAGDEDAGAEDTEDADATDGDAAEDVCTTENADVAGGTDDAEMGDADDDADGGTGASGRRDRRVAALIM